MGVALKYLSNSPIPFGGYARELEVTFRFSGQDDVKLMGHVRIENYTVAGPSLFAGFQSRRSANSLVFEKRYLGLFDDGYRSAGIFTSGDISIPFVIHLNKGNDQAQRHLGDLPVFGSQKAPQIQLLLTNAGRWVTIK